MTDEPSIKLTTQYTGGFSDTISLAIQDYVSNVPIGERIDPASVVNIIANFGGVKESMYFAYEYKRPVWLWKRLSKRLPRHWCGRYVTNSKSMTVKGPMKGTRL